MLEQAWTLAERSRCPRLMRDAGRLSFVASTTARAAPAATAATAATAEATVPPSVAKAGASVSAVWRLVNSIGVGFGNSLRLSSSGTREGLSEVLPPTWTVVTLALSPVQDGEEGEREGGRWGDLLIGRIEGGKRGRMVGARVGKAGEIRRLLGEFEEVMEGNSKTLHGRSAEEVAGWGKREKVGWWKERERLDERLGGMVRDLERTMGPWRWLMGGLVDEKEDGPVVGAVEAALSALDVEDEKEREGGGEQEESLAVLLRAALVGIADVRPMLSREQQREELNLVLKAVGLSVSAGQVDAALDCLAAAAAALVAIASRPTVSHRSVAGAVTGKGKITATKKKMRSSSNSSSDGGVEAKLESLCEDLSKLTIAELRKELAARFLPTTGAKAALLARLEEDSSSSTRRRKQKEKKDDVDDDTVEATRRDTAPPESSDALFTSRSTSSSSFSSSSISRPRASAGMKNMEKRSGQQRGPVLLVLDETLQRLPWESLPLLKGHPVSRCPSLEYIGATLRIHGRSSSRSRAKAEPRGKSTARGKKDKEYIPSIPSSSITNPPLPSVLTARCRSRALPASTSSTPKPTSPPPKQPSSQPLRHFMSLIPFLPPPLQARAKQRSSSGRGWWARRRVRTGLKASWRHQPSLSTVGMDLENFSWLEKT
eukprot:evm.model.NODE_23078_length_13312_cov_30.534330.3